MAYQKVNGCTHKPSIQQLVTIILYVIIIVLHSLYVAPGIIYVHQFNKCMEDHQKTGCLLNKEDQCVYKKQNGLCKGYEELVCLDQQERCGFNYGMKYGFVHSQIMIILLVILYLCLAIIIYDYIWITVHDPVDPLVLDPELLHTFPPYRLDTCQKCGRIQMDSYHCRRCGRCTQDFDHHCKFLNNCIGRRNYQNFLRLLAINMLFLILTIAQSLYVFLMAKNNKYVSDKTVPSYWAILAIIIISGLLLIAQGILLGFHCYISCCIDMTTIQYIKRQSHTEHNFQNNPHNSKLKQIRNSIIQFQNVDDNNNNNNKQQTARQLN